MSGACDNFILEDQSCEWFELVQYVESFDMGINFLEGQPGPPGPAGEAIFIPSVSEDGVLSWTNTAGLPNPDPIDLSGPAGTTDYTDLTNKPSINGVTLSGNKTTAELLISFSAADVGLGNVANERQYSSQNPPPYPVTTVNGQTGDVSVPTVTLPLAVSEGGTGADNAADAITNLGFESGSNYCKMPDGTLIQWGEATIPSESAKTTVTFPLAFANVNYAFFPTGIYTYTRDISFVSGANTATTMDIWHGSEDLSHNVRFKWLAIGRWK